MPLINAKAASVYSVSFKCATTDQKVQFDNERFKIYLVADADGNKTDGFNRVTPSDDEIQYASDLKKYIDTVPQTKSYKEFITDTNGESRVELTDGLYLITGETKVLNGYTYTPIPFLIQIDSRMESNLTSYVKYETTEPKPVAEKETTKATNVRTGDTSTPGPYMAAACISFMVFLLAIIERKRRNK